MKKQEVIWKPIENYSDYYEISNSGIIKSKDRVIYNSIGIILRLNKGKVMSFRLGKYKTIGLNKNGIQKQFLVHRLVALHFIPNLENKPCVNHIDGDKLNNNFNNLEWCTYSENNRHAFNTGLKASTWKDKKLSNETKLKMSNSKKGKPAHNKGKRQKEPLHGKMYEYNLGCRCDLCKKANTDYCRNKKPQPHKNKYDYERYSAKLFR